MKHTYENIVGLTPMEAYRIVKHTLMRFIPEPECISIYYDHYEDVFEFMPVFSTPEQDG